MKKVILGVMVACGLASTSIGSATHSEIIPDNLEIIAIYQEDQLDRASPEIDWDVVREKDSERLARVSALHLAGEITTARDFHLAAILYQHGDRPEHYLTAHIFATRAYSMGFSRSRWFVASTLDRYLLSTERPQVFGTQFELDDNGHAVPRNLLSEKDASALRSTLDISDELYEERRQLVEPYLRAAADK